MPQVTPFRARARWTLREELLEATAGQLTARGFRGLRLGEVAAAVGVSRQTVYNEFGDKERLVQAVVLRRTGEFLDGIDAAMDAAGELADGLRAAVTFALVRAAEDRLVAAVVTGGAADLLPYLTTRSEPVLSAATEHVLAHLHRHRPALAPQDGRRLAETVVRLTVSHLVLPTSAPSAAAADVVAVVCAALGIPQRKETR